MSATGQFLAAATTAFAELRRDPTEAVMTGSFPRALELLGKISIVHRTLESITDEDVLRRSLLGLHQATLPVSELQFPPEPTVRVATSS